MTPRNLKQAFEQGYEVLSINRIDLNIGVTMVKPCAPNSFTIFIVKCKYFVNKYPLIAVQFS